MPVLYRSMKASADGHPEVGPNARLLGVRDGIDIISQNGYVLPETGGMSVSPDDPKRLPRFRRPPELGGTGRDPTFTIESELLPSDLTYRADPLDPHSHGFIEPARPMTFAEFQQAIGETRLSWTRHSL